MLSESPYLICNYMYSKFIYGKSTAAVRYVRFRSELYDTIFIWYHTVRTQNCLDPLWGIGRFENVKLSFVCLLDCFIFLQSRNST